MKIYEADYEFHSGMRPKHALNYECEYSQTEGKVEIFREDLGPFGIKRYEFNTETDDLTEVYAAHPLYIINSVALVVCAGIVLSTGFEKDLLTIFGDILGILIPISAIAITIAPELILNQQPDGFRTANYPENELSDLQPVAFLNQVTFSKLVYLNYFAMGIIFHTEIFNRLHLLSPVYFLGISGVILFNKNSHDPATDKTMFLSMLGLLPYGTTLLNILIYSQWEKMISDIIGVLVKYISFTNELMRDMMLLGLSDLSSEQSRAITNMIQIWMENMQVGRDLLTDISQTPLIGLIVMNVAVIYAVLRLKGGFNSSGDPFGMYTDPPTITDKKYLRTGVSLLLAVYIVFSLTILGSQLTGSPLIPVDTVVSGILIFWPLCVIIPVWVAVWYQQRKDRTTGNDISACTYQFKFDGIPVIVRNTNDREGPAFVRSNKGDEVIVIDSQLHDELSDDEIKAVCYHELYHFTNDSMRPQTLVEIPIIGYLLFFISTNLEELYNDEYRANEFAAQQTSAKTVANALRKADSLRETTDKSKLKAQMDQGWWKFAKLLCSPPVLKLYSPPVKDRIERLNETTDQED